MLNLIKLMTLVRQGGCSVQVNHQPPGTFACSSDVDFYGFFLLTQGPFKAISMCSTWKHKHENENIIYILLFLHWSAMSLSIYVVCFTYVFGILLLLKLVLYSFQGCILLIKIIDHWCVINSHGALVSSITFSRPLLSSHAFTPWCGILF